MNDSQLLEEFVARNSQTAFQSLVARHLGLVHSTALRQVRDATLADEVAQAVFILLARKAARLHQTKNLLLGGWLYRTTRFVAARAVRGEMRRRRREQEAFQMQQLSSTDDTWRRIAPLLDEGIEQLDQTSRDAVILRFLQDEPLQAVGGALGISEEAARKRVTRSLEKLRAFFVRRGFTISTAVLATALAGHQAEAAPAGLAGAIGAKALAHASSSAAALPALVAETLQAWRWAKLKVLAGLAAVATVAASAVVLTTNTGSSPAHVRSDTTTAKPVSTAGPSAMPVAAAAAKSAVKTGWHFSFQAVDAQTGKGIANAKILVDSVGDMKQVTAMPQQIDRQTNLQTDAEGRCDIILPYAQPLMVSVGVVADGYEVTSAVGGSPRPLPDNFVLKVPRGSRIGGVVQDESGQPVAGAGIQVFFYDTSDSSSREFQPARPGLLEDDAVAATTDRAGRWTFASAPTNGDFSISVQHPDFPVASFHNDDDPRTYPEPATVKLEALHDGTAVLVLKSGLTLSGEVTDQNGYRITGAKVSHEPFFPESHTVSTGSDGSFALPALSPGENTITVMADGFAPQRIQIQMSSNTAPLSVPLKPGAVLKLQVLDQTGAPVPDARVALENWQGPNTLGWGGMTDANGRLVWNSAPLDPFTFSVLKDGYFNSRQNTLTADGQVHTITLRPQIIVAGRVTDATSKQPIPSFKAIPGPNLNETADGTNGLFQLTFTEFEQPLTVRIAADGYESATSPPLDPSVTNATCNFELKRLASQDAIEGVVLLPDGSTAAGVQVALANEHAVEMGKARFMPADGVVITQTDADGHFSFKPGLAAHAVLAVHQEGYASVPITPASHSVSIQLQPWGRVEGVLRLTTEPNSGQPITLAAPGVGQEETARLSLGAYTTKTDDQGNFVFDQAPPGQFNLYVTKINVAFSHQTPVQIQPGATTTVQIGGTGDILSGRLVLATPRPNVDWSKQLLIPSLQTKLPYPPGATGLARAKWYQNYKETDEGRARIRAVCTYPLVVQPDGAFTVEGVPPGDYELSGQLSDATVDLSRGILGRTIASFRQDVTIAPPANADSVEKIDLGPIPVQSQNP